MAKKHNFDFQALAQRIALAEFTSSAYVKPMGEGHGRNWEVFLDGSTLGFADGDTREEACAMVHCREVNNALHTASDSAAPGFMIEGVLLPCAQAIDDHAPFFAARSEVFKAGLDLSRAPLEWTPAMAVQASSEGWDIFNLDEDGMEPQIQLQDDDTVFATDEEDWSAVRCGNKPHHFVARTVLAVKSPFEYTRMMLAQAEPAAAPRMVRSA